MNSSGIADSTNKFIRKYLRETHSIKPAVVTAVDHSANKLNAKILTDTYVGSGVNIPQPDVFDVPFFILSANAGAAKITMPIANGDVVLILFSDRDYEDYLTTTGNQVVSNNNLRTHDYNPILALPCFYTAASSTDVSSTDISIENASTKVVIKPDGNIEMETSANIDATASAVNVTAATSTFNGDLVVNGSVSATGEVADGTRSMSGDRAIYNSHSSHPPNNM